MKKIFKIFTTLFISILIIFTNITKVNAASGSITVSSSTSKVVVGNTFTVTIKISSKSALGAWEFTPSYNTKLFKLTSGETPIVEVAEKDGVKSKSYTYKFKAIAKGNGSITVKSAGALSWNEEKMSLSVGSKSISVITQADLEASYSKNNNLKSLSVSGYNISPSFKSSVTEYKVDVNSNTEQVTINASKEDSKASISGTGTHEVSEGENKFNITVTAENGSTKTYSIIVNVIDPNPIKTTIDNKEYTVVKRESTLEAPTGYEKTQIDINEQKIPAFYNEITDFTLVGLKDAEGKIELFIFDKENKEYKKYSEAALDTFKIYPLKIDKQFDETYKKTNIKINDIDFEAMMQTNSNYYIIYAKNLLTGKNNYYKYDKTINSLITFDNDENLEPLKQELKKYKSFIVFLGAETVFVTLILIILLITAIVKKSKKKKLYKELKRKEQEKLKEKEEIIDEKEEIIEETTTEIEDNTSKEEEKEVKSKKKKKKKTKED